MQIKTDKSTEMTNGGWIWCVYRKSSESLWFDAQMRTIHSVLSFLFRLIQPVWQCVQVEGGEGGVHLFCFISSERCRHPGVKLWSRFPRAARSQNSDTESVTPPFLIPPTKLWFVDFSPKGNNHQWGTADLCRPASYNRSVEASWKCVVLKIEFTNDDIIILRFLTSWQKNSWQSWSDQRRAASPPPQQNWPIREEMSQFQVFTCLYTH